MGEPEGLLIDGARIAIAGARDLWWRVRPPTGAPILALERMRHRLELLLHALHGRIISIFPADPEPAPTWLSWLARRAPRHLASAGGLASTDGQHVWLPRTLDARDGEPAALDRFRLLAVEQASRLVRGFARSHPHDTPRVEQDLYWIATADAVDRGLARDLPGLAPGLRATRIAARSARPLLDRLTPTERAIEGMVRDVLEADLTVRPLGGIETPDDARAWARAQARRLEPARRYRGIAPVALWGEPRLPVPVAADREVEPADASSLASHPDHDPSPAPARAGRP